MPSEHPVPCFPQVAVVGWRCQHHGDGVKEGRSEGGEEVGQVVNRGSLSGSPPTRQARSKEVGGRRSRRRRSIHPT